MPIIARYTSPSSYLYHLCLLRGGNSQRETHQHILKGDFLTRLSLFGTYPNDRLTIQRMKPDNRGTGVAPLRPDRSSSATGYSGQALSRFPRLHLTERGNQLLDCTDNWQRTLNDRLFKGRQTLTHDRMSKEQRS